MKTENILSSYDDYSNYSMLIIDKTRDVSTLKFLNKEELQTHFLEILESLKSNKISIIIAEDLPNPYSVLEEEEYFFVQKNSIFVKILINNILWLKADRSYCEIVMQDLSKFVVCTPLLDVSKHLPMHEFIRISRSVILNFKHVDRLLGNTLYIGNQDFIIGSTYRRAIFKHLHFVGCKGRHSKNMPLE